MSVQDKYKILEDLYPDLLQDIGTLIQKGKLSKRFDNINLTDEEVIRLNKAKELCELKIVEYWEERDNETFKSLCSTYFDIAVLFPVNIDNEYFIYEQIKLFAFGYLGENWHFIRQYIKNNTKVFESLSNETDWSKRLLINSFKAIYHLIKKDSWEEINQAVGYINRLRGEQEEFEVSYLSRFENSNTRPYAAAELVALYHFSKNIEIIGQYLIEGRPIEPETQINYHTNISKEFANKSGNITLSLLFQFFEGFALKLIRNTVWYSTRGINNWVTSFNEFITKESNNNNIFELLYPQKESIVRGELLNPAHRAIVLNLPTSSGKTLIAEYRILQALNQFGGQENKKAWIAYLVPTKALVNQIYLQLNNDFGSIGLKVEKASGAIELDGFEQHLVEESGNQTDFDILVTTYEKMNLLVRQGLGTTEERPLILTIVDEAHNLEEKTRGLSLELLLSTIKNDCEDVNFLLMTPDISNSNDVVNWLAGDRGKVINLDLDWWQPNERVIGAIQIEGRGKKYDFVLKTLHTNKGTYEIGENIPLLHYENAELPKSKINSKLKIASHLSSRILDINSPIIVLASRINDTYKIADELYNNSNDIDDDEDIDLLIRFVESELGGNFPLARYLRRRIAIHSSALPDEIRFLIEDLMYKGKLQALVSTTTIAQGINFPVSAVIMGAYNYPFMGAMPVRDFWNLAGRVGRAGQNNMGWIGISAKNDTDLHNISEFVQNASNDLLSQLVGAIDTALQRADEDFSRWLFFDERWSAILQYISHLRRQTQQLDEFLSQLEQKLQSTFGYRQLSYNKKRFLKESIRRYARSISDLDAEKSDETGFSTISIDQMRRRLATKGLTPQDWQKEQLFSENNNSMRELVGIMINTYEIRNSIKKIAEGGEPINSNMIARLIIDWVNGRTISNISSRIFAEDNQGIQKTTKALYSVIANAATWGLAALQKMPTSGIDWDNLSKLEKKKIANLPAYLHYGVNTDEGVLMRKNNVPRTIANKLGYYYKQSVGENNIFDITSSDISEWLRRQDVRVWNNSVPKNSRLSGEDYKKIWEKLIGK